jgi:hypothetical protein
MKVQFELVVGENKFTLVEDVDSHADFFKKLHFYSTLPKVGPNGETDLVLTYRVAQKQYEYYSIVSKKAGMEFKFGQAKDAKGTLFAKGWEPLYQAENEEDGDAAQASVAGIGHVGIAAPAAAAPRKTTPAVDRTSGVAAAPQVSAKVAAPAAVQAQAADILAKFGI